MQAADNETARSLTRLGGFCAAQGRWAEAERHYREALRGDPQNVSAAFDLGLLLLLSGRYAEGFALYEARRRFDTIHLPRIPPVIPEWRGEPLGGRRIAVFGEQGFGDQIMFARFLRDLENRGAAATYFCAAEVAPLIAGARSVIAKSALSDYDCWTYVGSLPNRLGTTLETVPAPYPMKPGVGHGGVGVMARGRPEHSNDANRSLGAEFSSELLRLGRDLHPQETGARDFADTAEIVGGLDLVITVDTAVAHLAGSMGKPTWILLPAFGADWRWGREAATTPWYPTARLFRQPKPGDWAGVLQQVREALTN